MIGSIEAELISKKQGILEKLLYFCVDSYPVELALSDVQSYKDSGSFYNGLALIRQAAEQKIVKKIDKVNDVTGDGNAIIPGLAATTDSSTPPSNDTDQAIKAAKEAKQSATEAQKALEEVKTAIDEPAK